MDPLMFAGYNCLQLVLIQFEYKPKRYLFLSSKSRTEETKKSTISTMKLYSQSNEHDGTKSPTSCQAFIFHYEIVT